MKILITGFTPFGGEKINPAFEAINNMRSNINGVEIIKKELPTVFRKSLGILYHTIECEEPDVVICVGQAGGRSGISVERVAINVDDARIPDNDGKQPIDERIYNDGENAYFTNLPIKAMVKKLKQENIPSEVSNTAGTYVCNHLMYGLLYYIHKNNCDIRGGFVHVPFLPEQAINKRNMPSMSLDVITKGLETMVEAIVENKKDIKEAGGKIF
ncbi:pyroglutamyl-peptidase I [Oceanirhabdus sp. W0125-5]|uniref:pyroglutamyl-peptidase I n=1 Tax=Oceanirhabdus sp. W0125-5 TaxID=2999116 RepID=UPI0022F32AC1|nr:pyroglutamyl-peptidase I [Oceanirhabdus sp. W0125-5]WBW99336.1 pyroglutamyl-peptidase I [Oceanirhabdus sp. W0125-5]